ncbi:MAG: FAD:protein FMN transferase [Candidatus Anammoxibacter sp.]
MKQLHFALVFTALTLSIILPVKSAYSEYDYILGQKLTFDDIELPGNYDLQVYMSEEEAIETIFKKCDEIFVDYLTISPDEKKQLEDGLKREFNEDSFRVFIGKKDRKTEKYAIITDESGCFHQMTFVIAVKPDGIIDDVAVMVYRESRGKDVTRGRFLHQYKGKSIKDPIRLNRDIIHITGATTSVRGINRGVRKVLAVINRFYIDGDRKAPLSSYSRSKEQLKNLPKKEAGNLFSQAYFCKEDIMEILLSGVKEETASSAFKKTFDEVRRLDRMLNKKYKKGELHRVNKKAGKKAVECSDEFINIIKSTIRYSELTGGNFDITEGSVADKLQQKAKKPIKPDALKSLVKASSYKNITFEDLKGDGGGILLKEKLTNIDVSLITKGYIVDKAIELLEKLGISNALVNLGGNIRAIGNAPNGTGWEIAIPNPLKNDISAGHIKLTDNAVSISGDYERMLIRSRKKLSESYKIDATAPFNTVLLKAVVVAPTAFESDALSSIAVLSGTSHDMKSIDSMDNVEEIDFYEKEPGNVKTTLSTGMANYFIQKAEPISSTRSKPSCAF